jgi:hypothetical protein
MFMFVSVIGRGKLGKVDHSQGKGGERVVGILRFQGGNPWLYQLRTTLFWPQWTSFELY